MESSRRYTPLSKIKMLMKNELEMTYRKIYKIAPTANSEMSIIMRQ